MLAAAAWEVPDSKYTIGVVLGIDIWKTNAAILMSKLPDLCFNSGPETSSLIAEAECGFHVLVTAYSEPQSMVKTLKQPEQPDQRGHHSETG